MEVSLKTSADLRRIARDQLKGRWTYLALLSLLFIVISGIISGVPGLFGQRGETVGSILTQIASGPLTLGFTICFLKFVRSEDFTMANLFDGFRRFLPSFLLFLLTEILIILWSLLLIIPGIIAAYSYSMAFYIMADNADISALEAIKQSKAMMKGNKWRFFCLTFSFIGWILLGLLTLGIGLLWVIPYIQASAANFYENLKEAQSNAAL